MYSLAMLGHLEDADIHLDMAALTLAAADREFHNLTASNAYLDYLATCLSSNHMDSEARADHLVQILAYQEGFDGDYDDYDNPHNADFISVLARKRGLPIALAILYVSMARRVGWQADLIGLRGHVLVAVGDLNESILIDPFHFGQKIGTPDRLGDRAPTVLSNRDALVRLLLNQARRAQGAQDHERALRLFQRLTDIAPLYPQLWWERARLEQLSGHFDAARMALTAMRETTRDRRLTAQIRNTYMALPR